MGPSRWTTCPGAFQSTSNSVGTLATAITAQPALTLSFDTFTFWLGTYVVSQISSAVRFTKSVTTGD